MHLIELALKKVLAYSLILLPLTFFLGRSIRVSFFPTYLIGLSFFVLWLYQSRKVFSLSDCLVFGFLFYMSLTTLWSGEPSSVFIYIGYCLLLIAFLKSFEFSQDANFDVFRWFKFVLIASSTISAAISIYYFKTAMPEHISDNRLHAIGGLENPVIGALSYGAALIFSFSAMADTRSKVLRVALLACIGILATVIICTGTRSVWIGMFAGLIALILFLPQLKPKQKAKTIFLTTASLMVISTALWDSELQQALLTRSTSFRPEIWLEVISKMTSDRLLFGYGINADEAIHYQNLTFDHPHSIYLATLFYGGILGLGLFLTMIIYIYSTLIRNVNNVHVIYILPLLTYGLVCLLFDGNRPLVKINFTWFLLWLPIGLTLAMARKPKMP